MPKKYCDLPIVTYEKNVIKSDGCWGWNNAKSEGYGVIGRTRLDRTVQRFYIHRLSYEHHIGKIPKGMDVMHLCHNPECSNPAHLSVGFRKENMQTSRASGRLQRKIPLDAMPKIRSLRLSGMTYTEIAKQYGCTNVAVRHMVNNHV